MVVARAGGRLCGPALRHRPPGARAGARDDLGPGAGRADRRRGRRPRPPSRTGRGRRIDLEGERDVLLWGLLVAFATAVVLSIPFAVSGRWGLLGVGFNNDLGLHLAWAEWLRSGFGPAPEAGYPLGPHALADAVAAVPGIGLGQAFVGEIFAIGILTSLTALAALPGLGPVRRVLGAVLVAASYLAASYYAQGAFKETAEALFVLAVALALRDPAPLPAGRGRAAPLRPPLPRPRRRRPLRLQLRRPRLADRRRRALEPDRAGGAAGAGAALADPLPAAADDADRDRARRRDRGPDHRWSGRSGSAPASTESPAATPTARSPRSRRSGSGGPPTTASTRRASRPCRGWRRRSAAPRWRRG